MEGAGLLLMLEAVTEESEDGPAAGADDPTEIG